MPRRYPVEFRRKVLDLIETGRPVVEIAAQLGVSDQTIYNWCKQDHIDRGLRAGVITAESVELTAARKRIRELETELGVDIFVRRGKRVTGLTAVGTHLVVIAERILDEADALRHCAQNYGERAPRVAHGVFEEVGLQ